jgi:hypothetical protein
MAQFCSDLASLRREGGMSWSDLKFSLSHVFKHVARESALSCSAQEHVAACATVHSHDDPPVTALNVWLQQS